MTYFHPQSVPNLLKVTRAKTKVSWRGEKKNNNLPSSMSDITPSSQPLMPILTVFLDIRILGLLRRIWTGLVNIKERSACVGPTPRPSCGPWLVGLIKGKSLRLWTTENAPHGHK